MSSFTTLPRADELAPLTAALPRVRVARGGDLANLLRSAPMAGCTTSATQSSSLDMTRGCTCSGCRCGLSFHSLACTRIARIERSDAVCDQIKSALLQLQHVREEIDRMLTLYGVSPARTPGADGGDAHSAHTQLAPHFREVCNLSPQN